MLKIIYAGSPDVAVQPLIEIAQSGQHQIVAVLSNAPSPQGRKKELVATPVAQAAERLGLAVLQPEKLDEGVRQTISALQPDLLVCFAYGKIFGPKFMALFPMGGINLHPSLLPLHRGCAPVPAAILNGDSETGISIQRIFAEMDSGDILLQTRFPLTKTDTSASVLERVSREGGALLLQVLTQLEDGTQTDTPQDHSKATYCSMLCKEDGSINWNDSAKKIQALVCAFNPWPCACTSVGGAGLTIHEATVYTGEHSDKNAAPGTVLGVDKKEGVLIQTGDGVLAVQNLQWQAKKALHWKDFINGSRSFVGSVCT